VTPAAPLRVTVWGEHVHERTSRAVAAIYPRGMHAELADAIGEFADRPVEVRTATLDEDECGLPERLLDATDVLVWWAHVAHDRIPDELAERVRLRVLAGMGFVPLHSASLSKPFLRLMGTSCTFRWREAEDRQLVWVVDPGHRIARDLPPVIDIPRDEMYGEFFDIPAPDELVFISSFSGGEVFRSGCCFRRGAGRVFYFSPGHETHPVYHQPEVRRAIANGVAWAAAP
jgi:trehalose utilization protein